MDSAGRLVEAGQGRRQRLRLMVRGAVQGVGFRPFVYRQAQALGLSGWVANTPAGVTLEVEGPGEVLAAFRQNIRAAPPPGAVVTGVEAEPLTPRGETGFEIRASMVAGSRTTRVLADLATCEACRLELFDSADRRFRYPFINCTHCGPRFSIIEDLPYDRGRTAMRRFPMCEACRDEYEAPGDRRFHAEPNACPACGPQLALWDAAAGVLHDRDAALAGAVAALRRGEIVAVKGLGGFHLMVDARDDDAVRRLRARKRRQDKPFAVMFASLAAIEEACRVTPEEAALLVSTERPIVLVRRNADRLAPAVAPRNPFLGAMLPATPLHHLLMVDFGSEVVATSGNVSDEPIVIDEHAAVTRLAGIADLFLVHDRPIVRPVDDSVVRIVAGRPQILRLARGYAPASVVEAKIPPGILALGGHLKSAIAISTGSGVVAGQHVGDLSTGEARDAHAQNRADLVNLHAVTPRVVVRDLHPDYHTSRIADGTGLPVVAVQHHLAHVAAGMAEHGLSPPVLGVAWDGTGYGLDGTIWGGEFLLVTADGWRRVAHLRPFRLPGGEAAVREPRRSAFGLLAAAFGDDVSSMTGLSPVAAFSTAERATLLTMIRREVNAPLTTSAGRLFDAVAAIVGLRQTTSYEGQAAAELEWAIDRHETDDDARYRFTLGGGEAGAPRIIDWEPVLRAVLLDVEQGCAIGLISARFHAALACVIAEVAVEIGEPTVVLTGGCFQNTHLTEAAVARLRAARLTPWWHQKVPANDGGLALGQAMWAARMIDKGEVPCA